MRITSKGQVTVPAHIRQRLGWHEGTEIEFVLDGNAVRVVQAEDGSYGERLTRRLRGTGGASGMTTDELMSLLRDDNT